MCKSNICLNNKCCASYVSKQKKCSSCDNGGNCVGCVSGYSYHNFGEGLYKYNDCYKYEYLRVLNNKDTNQKKINQ